jgi:hypothetical protein
MIMVTEYEFHPIANIFPLMTGGRIDGPSGGHHLSVIDVATATDLSVPNIYKHIALGHIEAIKPPHFKNYIIPVASLTAFLKARAEGKFVRPAKRVKQ